MADMFGLGALISGHSPASPSAAGSGFGNYGDTSIPAPPVESPFAARMKQKGVPPVTAPFGGGQASLPPMSQPPPFGGPPPVHAAPAMKPPGPAGLTGLAQAQQQGLSVALPPGIGSLRHQEGKPASAAPRSADSPATLGPAIGQQQGLFPPPAAAAAPAQADPMGQILSSQLKTRWGSRGGMEGGPAIYRSGQLTPDDHGLFSAIDQHQGAMAHGLRGQAELLGAKADWAKTPAGLMEHPMGAAILDHQLQAGGSIEGPSAAAGYGPPGQIPLGPAGAAYRQAKYPDMPTDPNMMSDYHRRRQAQDPDSGSLARSIMAQLQEAMPGEEYQQWQQPGMFGMGSQQAAQNKAFVDDLMRQGMLGRR